MPMQETETGGSWVKGPETVSVNFYPKGDRHDLQNALYSRDGRLSLHFPLIEKEKEKC